MLPCGERHESRNPNLRIQQVIIGAFVLFGITFVGILLACKTFAYEITWARKIGAAFAFSILNIIPIPIPFFSLLIPPIGLYMALMDNTYQRSVVNKVFGVTLLFAIVATLWIYRLR